MTVDNLFHADFAKARSDLRIPCAAYDQKWTRKAKKLTEDSLSSL